MSNQSLRENKHYTFNAESNKYIFHTEKKFGQNLVITKSQIDTIVKLYSKLTGNHTAGEIALKMSIPGDVIRHILRVMKITHESLPFTDETLEQSEFQFLEDDAMLSRKFNLLQKIERRDWKETQQDAEKWRNLKLHLLDPFESFLERWTPPKYVPLKSNPPAVQKSEDTILVGLSDWHYGLVAHERYLYNQKEWNIQETEKSVSMYAKKVTEQIRKGSYKDVKLLLLGDISHTLNGFTDKGTRLEAHPIAEEQLEIAFNSLVNFVTEVLTVSKTVTVHACSGNHSALGDYVLARMLQQYFRTEKRIKFEVSSKRFITFKIGKNLFLMEHGYSSVTKSRLPASKTQRERYVNSILMSKPELMEGTIRNYYLSADQHHSESYELANVEGFMFPTLVGGCRYSDNSGYKSRPRQTALVVNDQDGVTDVKHFYFD